ncbi:MAG: type II toxin-antitoxin system VapC family toxin [Alphaproteobacteria bacterium]|nr:MAG: type II toxin-antitoxin system VapC family toxin [Alphaproteobacteria bacterium]
MKALDTNLLVRVVAGDDEAQRVAARAIMAAGDVLLLPTVLMEAEWVLRSRYGLGRVDIAKGLHTLCALEGVTVASAEAVAKALGSYVVQGDFADLLHFALAAEQGATAFATFDRNFTRPAGESLKVEIIK